MCQAPNCGGLELNVARSFIADNEIIGGNLFFSNRGLQVPALRADWRWDSNYVANIDAEHCLRANQLQTRQFRFPGVNPQGTPSTTTSAPCSWCIIGLQTRPRCFPTAVGSQTDPRWGVPLLFLPAFCILFERVSASLEDMCNFFLSPMYWQRITNDGPFFSLNFFCYVWFGRPLLRFP